MKWSLLFVFFCVSTLLFSQKNLFVGSLLLQNNSVLPYSLDIEIDSNYNVFGYSHFGEGKTSVSYYIDGHFDPKDNSIFLKEQDKNGNFTNDCPIIIQGRVNHLIENIFVIAGVYVPKNKSICGSGHINVVNRNFLFHLYNKAIAVPISMSDSQNTEVLKTLLKSNLSEEEKFLPVTSADINKINTTSKSITLRVYDQMKIDNDKVKIRFNNQVIDNIELTARKREFILTAKSGANILTIQAISEGSIPMNTSKMELILGDSAHYFINKLNKNQKSTYVITLE